MVRLLLDHGAAINRVDRLGRSAMHVACCYGRLEVTQLLLDRGAAMDDLDM